MIVKREDLERAEEKVREIERQIEMVKNAPAGSFLKTLNLKRLEEILVERKAHLGRLRQYLKEGLPQNPYQRDKFIKETREMGERLRDLLVPKDLMMGVKMGRGKTDGRGHDIRQAEERAVEENYKFKMKYSRLQAEYDRRVALINLLYGVNDFKRSDEIRRGREI